MIKRSAASLTMIASIFVITVSPSSAQVGSMRANLKVGLSVDAVVDEVTEWGFWLEDETGLLYKQLTSLSTTSDSLSKEVMRFVPDAVVDTTASTTTINFEGLTFPERIPKPRTALRSRTISGGLQAGITAELETNLEASIPGLNNFLGRIGHSIGWSVVDKGNFLGGFQVGIGRLFPAGRNQISVTAEAWQKYSNSGSVPEDSPKQSIRMAPDAYAISAFYLLPVQGGQYTLSIGARGYLKNVEYEGNTSRVAVVVLIGSPI